MIEGDYLPMTIKAIRDCLNSNDEKYIDTAHYHVFNVLLNATFTNYWYAMRFHFCEALCLLSIIGQVLVCVRSLISDSHSSFILVTSWQ